jgi:8-oxo-dGTP pyrophosphatase MutT (NUDIX family)
VIEAAILNRLVARLATALAPPAMPLQPFVVDGVVVGELDAARAARLRAFADVFDGREDRVAFVPEVATSDARTQAMAHVARTLATEGELSAWRDERYGVARAFAAPPLFLLERAAARYCGIRTYAVHVNGTTRLADGREAMWIARRSDTKSIDAGLLDNMVGGGIAAGADVHGTLVKEAWEEAGLPADVALRAVAAGEVRFRRAQPDGIQNETIFVHDLELPVEVVPVNQDGEVAAFRLVPAEEVAMLAGNDAGRDVVTADAGLVIADWLLRRGAMSAGSEAARRLAGWRGGARQP